MITLPFIILPFPLVVLAVALQATGILFAPFAALVCARLAKKGNLSVRRYALYGAIHSVLLFLPWLYLVRKMQGKPMIADTIKTWIKVVFIIWLGILVCLGAFLVTPLEEGWPPWRSEFDHEPAEWVMWWTLLVAELLGIPFFAASGYVLKHRLSPKIKQLLQRNTHLSQFVNYAPFVGLSAHALSLLVLIGYVYATTGLRILAPGSVN